VSALVLSLPGEPRPTDAIRKPCVFKNCWSAFTSSPMEATVRFRVKRSERNRLVLCKRITFRMADATLNGTPHYLHKHYWWAYVHPRAVWFFERQWLINLILYGNYAKLRDATLEEFTHDLQGNLLQVSCCYGDLSPRLAERVAKCGGSMDVVDVLPGQLANLKRKLPANTSVHLREMNAVHLEFPDNHFDTVLLFFLLHEEPQEYREKTLEEAMRVLKPEGKLVIVDFGNASRWHPFRYLWLPFLGLLEPFAVALWNNELTDIVPAQMLRRTWRKTSYFGGLFQKLASKR